MFKCKLCKPTFKFNCFYLKHAESHLPRSERPSFPCQHRLCGKVFTSKSTLWRHTNHVHGDHQPLICEICTSTYSSKTHMKEHMERIHGNGIKDFECDYRGKKVFSKPELVRVRIHTGEKPFKCDVCRKEFTCKSSLARHKRTHSGLRPYTCTHCGKSFGCSTSLNAHQKIHTVVAEKDRPKCVMCDRRFSCVQSMQRHIRSTHTGENAYACPFCEHKCNLLDTLRDHVRSHTGEKPYKCDTCGTSFTSSGHLTEHLRSKTHKKMAKARASTTTTEMAMKADRQTIRIRWRVSKLNYDYFLVK